MRFPCNATFSHAKNDNALIGLLFLFADHVDAIVQSRLVTNAIALLNDQGAVVHGVVMDGCYANQRTARILGVSFQDPFEPSFIHPGTDRRIFFIFDPCHMLKLVRNFFSHFGCLVDADGEEIRWDFIEKLHRLQQQEGLHVANKLRESHIAWRKQVMKVRLAAQTLSRSVASALDFLRLGNIAGQFAGSAATSRFLRIVDGLFDRLNASTITGYGTKSAWTAQTIDEIESDLHNAIVYLSGLKTPSGKLVIESQRRTAVIGFQCAAVGMVGIARRLLVREETFIFFLPYKCSQDHIEILFSLLRRRGGWNNNPNVVQVSKERVYTVYRINRFIRDSAGVETNHDLSDMTSNSV